MVIVGHSQEAARAVDGAGAVGAGEPPPRTPRSGWAWHGAARSGSGVLDHRSAAARELRDAYYKQIYWYHLRYINKSQDHRVLQIH